jgi:hypothetical protein
MTINWDRIDEISTASGGRPAVVPQKYYDDTAAEHGKLMPLVGTATHTSVKDGNWTDATVWDAGTVPGDGARVRIYHRVTYNSTSTAKLDSVSVNGTLKLTSTKSVMWVDTLFGHGVLDGGTAKSPAKAEFIFLRMQAPETTTRLGMTWMGRVRLHGEPKTARLHSVADIPAGATSCDLEGLGAANWAVGDKILFIATEVLPNASTDPQYRGPPQVWTTYQGQAGTASDYKVLKSDNGFRQSADEVRTITAISGEALTWDAPLAHAHKVYGGTLPHGQVVTVNPPVCDLTRSIVFRSADASEGGDLADLQQRAQVMLCHNDDVQVRYVEFRDTGRSSTDPSLVRADGKLAYATNPAATPPPAPITNPLNVPGYFAFHLHSTGPYFGRRQVPVVGCTVWAPTEAPPIPGWALVHHNSRAAIEECVVYNARGAGMVSELGTEIGQWINNTVAWCRGDGYKNGWGTRAEYWPHHDGHMGAAYECQARQILQLGNLASSSTYGWLFQPQHDGNTTRRSPDGQSLRYRDPVVQGGGEQNSYVNSWPEMKDLYFPDQPQIIFDDNIAYAVGSGFAVIHRHKQDLYDLTPLIARRNHFINVGTAVNIVNYTYSYSFHDSLWVGSSGTGNAASLGPVSYDFNFVNILFRNWALAIKDAGVGLNYGAFAIDCGLEEVDQFSNHFNPTMSSDPALSSKKDIMGPWTNIAKTGSSSWTLRARTYVNLNSKTDLPQQYPLPIVWAGTAWGVSGSVPVPPADTPSVLPGDPPIWIPNAANDLTKPATGRGGVQISGVIRDSVGDRKYPDWQSSETFPKNIGYKGPRRAHYMTGIQMVERNGCFEDDGKWKCPLWFCDHDRFTGQHFVFRVDVLLGSDYDPAFLEANVVDPLATRPALPLLPERLRQDEPEPEPEPGVETVHLDITKSAGVTLTIAVNGEPW